jgi:hypothetical protein
MKNQNFGLPLEYQERLEYFAKFGFTDSTKLQKYQIANQDDECFVWEKI